MQKPTLIIVGADKGGVGKTTLSRTLLDYFNAAQISVRAFDTEYPHGTLKRFYPDITTIVDATSVRDQMRIFDALNDSQVTLIDVRAGLLTSTLNALRDIGFFETVKREQVRFAVVHVVGPSIASLNEINLIAPFMTNGRYFLAKNFINDTRFFDWDHTTYDSYFGKVPNPSEIVAPKLNELAFEQVELASVPFMTFISNKDASGNPAEFSFVLRGYVRHWLSAIWAEYDRVRLKDFVGARSGKEFNQPDAARSLPESPKAPGSPLRFVKTTPEPELQSETIERD